MMIDYQTYTAIQCLVVFIIGVAAGVAAGILVGYGYSNKE